MKHTRFATLSKAITAILTAIGDDESLTTEQIMRTLIGRKYRESVGMVRDRELTEVIETMMETDTITEVDGEGETTEYQLTERVHKDEDEEEEQEKADEPAVKANGHANGHGDSNGHNVIKIDALPVGEDNPYEVLQLVRNWRLSFSLGNVLMLIFGSRRKNIDAQIQDLKTAMFYLQDEMLHLEKQRPKLLESPKAKTASREAN